MKGKFSKWLLVTVICSTIPTGSAANMISPAQAQPASRVFQETGHSLKSRFLEYWEQHGGLSQQGYPISEEMQERSDTDGKTYIVQYMERAVFEHHPENRPPNDVLLSLVGVFEYKKNYPSGAPGQAPNTEPGSLLFTQTGNQVGGAFLAYWSSHGGLAQQGYPISDEFQERSALDGKTYTVQYFERAVFEFHPENSGTPYVVLLSQLGTFRFREQYIITVPIAPAPINRRQSLPRLSEQYLVWQEVTEPPGSGGDFRTDDVSAIDLKARKLVSLTGSKPGARNQPDVSGSVVVWNDTVGECPNCYRSILAKDLASGIEYQIAVEPATYRARPVIAGRRIAWTECQKSNCQLLLRDLDGKESSRVISTGPFSVDISLQMSDEYIVWTGAGSCSGEELPLSAECIRAYHRKTGVTKAVREFKVGSRHLDATTPIRYALANNKLVMGEKANADEHDTAMVLTAVLDLNTGETIADPTSGLVGRFIMSGDIIVWDTNYLCCDEVDIWGMNIKENKRMLLVTGKGIQKNPVIAGDWLAWENVGGPNSRLIGAMSLSAAFATAEDRQKVKLPPKQITEHIRDVDMVSLDEGWAVGQGVILHYMAGKWKKMDSPGKATLFDVEMVSKDEGWAVGALSTEVVMLHYKGGMWNIVDPSIPESKRVRYLREIDMVSADEGWAVGNEIMMHYSQGTWQEVQLPYSLSLDLVRLSMLSPDEGWAIGTYGRILHYQDRKWELIGDDYPKGLYDIDIFSANEGWIVSYQAGLLHYTGGRWQMAPNPTGATVDAIDMISEREGWAVGSGGGILHYKEGSWELAEVGVRGVGFNGIDMISPEEGWIVGSDGTLLHYLNEKWSPYER